MNTDNLNWRGYCSNIVNLLVSVMTDLNDFETKIFKYVKCVFFFYGEKPLLVPTFLGDSHFSLYILFLPLLVSILKNASRFNPCYYIKNGES